MPKKKKKKKNEPEPVSSLSRIFSWALSKKSSPNSRTVSDSSVAGPTTGSSDQIFQTSKKSRVKSSHQSNHDTLQKAEPPKSRRRAKSKTAFNSKGDGIPEKLLAYDSSSESEWPVFAKPYNKSRWTMAGSSAETRPLLMSPFNLNPATADNTIQELGPSKVSSLPEASVRLSRTKHVSMGKHMMRQETGSLPNEYGGDACKDTAPSIQSINDLKQRLEASEETVKDLEQKLRETEVGLSMRLANAEVLVREMEAKQSALPGDKEDSENAQTKKNSSSSIACNLENIWQSKFQKVLNDLNEQIKVSDDLVNALRIKVRKSEVEFHQKLMKADQLVKDIGIKQDAREDLLKLYVKERQSAIEKKVETMLEREPDIEKKEKELEEKQSQAENHIKDILERQSKSEEILHDLQKHIDSTQGLKEEFVLSFATLEEKLIKRQGALEQVVVKAAQHRKCSKEMSKLHHSLNEMQQHVLKMEETVAKVAEIQKETGEVLCKVQESKEESRELESEKENKYAKLNQLVEDLSSRLKNVETHTDSFQQQLASSVNQVNKLMMRQSKDQDSLHQTSIDTEDVLTQLQSRLAKVEYELKNAKGRLVVEEDETRNKSVANNVMKYLRKKLAIAHEEICKMERAIQEVKYNQTMEGDIVKELLERMSKAESKASEIQGRQECSTGIVRDLAQILLSLDNEHGRKEMNMEFDIQTVHIALESLASNFYRHLESLVDERKLPTSTQPRQNTPKSNIRQADVRREPCSSEFSVESSRFVPISQCEYRRGNQSAESTREISDRKIGKKKEVSFAYVDDYLSSERQHEKSANMSNNVYSGSLSPIAEVLERSFEMAFNEEQSFSPKHQEKAQTHNETSYEAPYQLSITEVFGRHCHSLYADQNGQQSNWEDLDDDTKVLHAVKEFKQKKLRKQNLSGQQISLDGIHRLYHSLSNTAVNQDESLSVDGKEDSSEGAPVSPEELFNKMKTARRLEGIVKRIVLKFEDLQTTSALQGKYDQAKSSSRFLPKRSRANCRRDAETFDTKCQTNVSKTAVDLAEDAQGNINESANKFASRLLNMNIARSSTKRKDVSTKTTGKGKTCPPTVQQLLRKLMTNTQCKKTVDTQGTKSPSEELWDDETELSGVEVYKGKNQNASSSRESYLEDNKCCFIRIPFGKSLKQTVALELITPNGDGKDQGLNQSGHLIHYLRFPSIQCLSQDSVSRRSNERWFQEISHGLCNKSLRVERFLQKHDEQSLRLKTRKPCANKMCTSLQNVSASQFVHSEDETRTKSGIHTTNTCIVHNGYQIERRHTRRPWIGRLLYSGHLTGIPKQKKNGTLMSSLPRRILLDGTYCIMCPSWV